MCDSPCPCSPGHLPLRVTGAPRAGHIGVRVAPSPRAIAQLRGQGKKRNAAHTKRLGEKHGRQQHKQNAYSKDSAYVCHTWWFKTKCVMNCSRSFSPRCAKHAHTHGAAPLLRGAAPFVLDSLLVVTRRILPHYCASILVVRCWHGRYHGLLAAAAAALASRLFAD
jgi:hypothetical protein